VLINFYILLNRNNFNKHKDIIFMRNQLLADDCFSLLNQNKGSNVSQILQAADHPFLHYLIKFSSYKVKSGKRQPAFNNLNYSLYNSSSSLRVIGCQYCVSRTSKPVVSRYSSSLSEDRIALLKAKEPTT